MTPDEATEETLCPIARTLNVACDRGTLLIMRELSMGNHRFDEIQAQTGLSPTLLSARLKRLEESGLIERRIYSSKPRRYEYHATEKGLDLDAILVMLRAWGMKWTPYDDGQGPAISITDRETGKQVDQDTSISASFRFSDYDGTLSAEFANERALRRSRFQQDRRAKSS
ncbi:winged helix-turn-helix transcriptional regulator [Rhizobium sp. Rhizsp42]|uniref:winged helix-turn-helix transcriptional regulator n=1 Tax=Rhizobium sp. Rhizsp42 TaxID=3243034 RepID=UPI0039B039FD